MGHCFHSNCVVVANDEHQIIPGITWQPKGVPLKKHHHNDLFLN